VREPLSNAYKEMLSHVFSKYIGEFDTAAEVGCGPHASFYKNFPEKFKSRWNMCDVNRDSAYVAKGEHENGEFIVADFHKMPFRDKSADVVAGFNSFETTKYLAVAINESYRTLRPSGCLLAMQDVIPSSFATIIKERERTGKDVVEAKVSMRDEDTPVLIKTKCGDVDVRSYHIGMLEEAGTISGLKTVFNRILESDGIYSRTAKHDIHTIRPGQKEFKNSFVDLAASPRFTYDPSIPEGYVRECVAANVLVMQK
jgi:ubiquinone/menaquinone biosynthesis C-methylase UbiE